MLIDLKMLIIFCVAALVVCGVAGWKPYWIIGLFMATTIVKSIARAYFPFLASYTYDMWVAGLAFIAVLANYLRTRDLPKLQWNKTLFICFGIMVAVGILLYPLTRAPEYGFKKLLMFGIYTTISLLIPPQFLRSEQNVRQLIKVMLVIGIVASVGTLFFSSKMYGAEDYTRDTFLHTNPLSPSDAAAIASIVVLGFWLIGKRGWWAILIPLFMAGIVVTGSRGAVWGVGACFLLFLYVARSKAFLQALLISPIVLLLLYFAVGFIQDRAGTRFTTESMGQGLEDRFYMIRTTINGWWGNNPMGGGPGDSGYILTGEDEHDYPHNSLVEALCDLGPVGFVCLLIVYWKVLRQLLLLHRQEWRQNPIFVHISIIGGAALYYLLMAFKTGSFYSSFLTWFYFSAFLHCCFRFSSERYLEDMEYDLSYDFPLSDVSK